MRQLDYQGREYDMRLLDNEGNKIDEYRIDGDPLLSNLVSSTIHMGNGTGLCDKCKFHEFNVNNGKEYCGLCNEFYDTYKYIRESNEATSRQEKLVRAIARDAEKARREGDFVKMKELEDALVWAQMDDYQKTATELQRQENIRRRQMDEYQKQLNKSQNAYLAKKLNHMNANRANYYDIP